MHVIVPFGIFCPLSKPAELTIQYLILNLHKCGCSIKVSQSLLSYARMANLGSDSGYASVSLLLPFGPVPT